MFMFGHFDLMFNLFQIIFWVMFISIFGITIISITPWGREKILKYRINEKRRLMSNLKEDIKDMSKEEAELKRAIYEDSEDVLKDIAIREADIASSGDRIRAQVFKDVFDDQEDKKVVYCKYCGQAIDIDSVYCKHCGQKQ